MIVLHFFIKITKKYLTVFNLKLEHLALTTLTFSIKTASERNAEYEECLH